MPPTIEAAKAKTALAASSVAGNQKECETRKFFRVDHALSKISKIITIHVYVPLWQTVEETSFYWMLLFPDSGPVRGPYRILTGQPSLPIPSPDWDLTGMGFNGQNYFNVTWAHSGKAVPRVAHENPVRDLTGPANWVLKRK